MATMVEDTHFDRIAVAKLLRLLIDNQIDEQAFRDQTSRAAQSSDDPFIELAYDEAEDYLRTLGELTIFGKPRPPDPYQVSSGKEALLIMARGIEESWPLKSIREALRWV
ncbi:MAG: hypothetical protein ACLPXM_16820 [Terriglobales bacterium]